MISRLSRLLTFIDIANHYIRISDCNSTNKTLKKVSPVRCIKFALMQRKDYPINGCALDTSMLTVISNYRPEPFHLNILQDKSLRDNMVSLSNKSLYPINFF